MGVNAFKFKLWAFAIGAALGATAGLLFASKQAYVEPTGFALNLSFLFVAMVVIGGSGNMYGAMLGAFLHHLPARAVPRVPGLAPVRLRRGHGRGDGAAAPGPRPEPQTGPGVRGPQARGRGGCHRCLAR